MKYEEFLATKFKFTQAYGFPCSPKALNPWLKPHCRDIVRWALQGGRRAIFASFGLHKTSMQLEIMYQIGVHEGGRQLIIAPLTPIEEFIEEAGKMSISISFVKSTEQVKGDGIYITNYESVRDGKLDVALFMAVSLDEASVLRSYGSKTYQEFLTMFGDVKYRFVATATPSPNRHKELIHYAGFLGIMETGQARSGLVYDYEDHIEIGEALDRKGALPATFMSLVPGSSHPEVWSDVNRMRTLNGDQVQRNLTSHICPLQFDIVDRIIRRYTNEGEVVYDPFGGIMTVPYRAIKLGRYGRAAELSAEYFRDGVRYLREAEAKRNAPSLFDVLDAEQAVSA